MFSIVQSEMISSNTVSDWRTEISSVIAYAYSDLGDLLDKEVVVGSEIDFIRDDLGLTSFFLTKSVPIEAQLGVDSAVYLGLSGTIVSERSRGHRAACVGARVATLKSRWSNKKMLAFATTATPPSYFVAEALFSRIAPLRDGSLDEKDDAALRSFCKIVFDYENEKEPPFILRGLSSCRYTSDERLKQERSIQELPFFQDYCLDERNGDRAAFLAETQ